MIIGYPLALCTYVNQSLLDDKIFFHDISPTHISPDTTIKYTSSSAD